MGPCGSSRPHDITEFCRLPAAPQSGLVRRFLLWVPRSSFHGQRTGGGHQADGRRLASSVLRCIQHGGPSSVPSGPPFAHPTVKTGLLPGRHQMPGQLSVKGRGPGPPHPLGAAYMGRGPSPDQVAGGAAGGRLPQALPQTVADLRVPAARKTHAESLPSLVRTELSAWELINRPPAPVPGEPIRRYQELAHRRAAKMAEEGVWPRDRRGLGDWRSVPRKGKLALPGGGRGAWYTSAEGTGPGRPPPPRGLARAGQSARRSTCHWAVGQVPWG